MKKYKQAILCFDKILKENPEEMNLLYLKAKSTVKQQNNKKACMLISKLLKLERKNDHHNHEHEHEGNGHEHFLNKIKKDSDFIGLKNDINFKETKILKLNSFKAKKKLNWTSKWNLKKSITKTLEWNENIKKGISQIDICEQQFLVYINKD